MSNQLGSWFDFWFWFWFKFWFTTVSANFWFGLTLPNDVTIYGY